MTADYKLHIRTPTGGLIAVATDFLSMGYTKRRSALGVGVFTLSGKHLSATSLERDGIVEIWRQDLRSGLPWYRDFSGLIRGIRWTRTDLEAVTVTLASPLDLLRRRIIAFPADTASRSSFANDPAETILKTIVRYNATALATVANGRDLAGNFTNLSLSVEADLGRGAQTATANSRRPLLEVCQEIRDSAGDLDFDIIQTGDATFEFRYYDGQRGSDKTGSVVFAIERGNVAMVDYLEDWDGQANVAVVAGQGEGAAREVQVVYADDYASADHSEIFVDARDVDPGDTARLVARGGSALLEVAGLHELTFDVISSRSTVYGRDWDLGDVVTGLYRNVEAKLWVEEVSISVDQAGERIGVGV